MASWISKRCKQLFQKCKNVRSLNTKPYRIILWHENLVHVSKFSRKGTLVKIIWPSTWHIKCPFMSGATAAAATASNPTQLISGRGKWKPQGQEMFTSGTGKCIKANSILYTTCWPLTFNNQVLDLGSTATEINTGNIWKKKKKKCTVTCSVH